MSTVGVVLFRLQNDEDCRGRLRLLNDLSGTWNIKKVRSFQSISGKVRCVTCLLSKDLFI